MKNTVAIFDTTDIYSDYTVTDYTSRQLYDIYKLKEIKDPKYVNYYQLSDNETLEQVSYKLYGDAKYWDVLLYINQADPLYDMVYDFDLTSSIATKFIQEYNTNIYIDTLPFDYIDTLVQNKIAELEDIKEMRRPLKIIRPNRLLDFMKLLRQSEII